MNLNLYIFFLIMIWIKTIYSQICVNFRILGENGDERAKGEKTGWKGKDGMFKTHPISPKWAHKEVGFFSRPTPQATKNSSKREVT